MCAFLAYDIYLDQGSCKGVEHCFKAASRACEKHRDCHSFAIQSDCSASSGELTEMLLTCICSFKRTKMQQT